MNDESRVIWSRLVDYANNAPGSDLAGLRMAVKLCLPWAARDAAFGFLDRYDVERLNEEAAEFHSPIKELLVGLCAGPDKRLSFDSWDFVRSHGQHVKTDFEQPPFVSDDADWIAEGHHAESLKAWKPNGMMRSTLLHGYVRIRNYSDLADPIIDFVLSEYERVQKAGASFPIFVCGNTRCGKLVMPERIGRGMFCDAKCKSAAQRSADPVGEFTEYQWLRRLRLKTATKRGAFLALSENMSRYQILKAAPPSDRCQGLIQKLENSLR